MNNSLIDDSLIYEILNVIDSSPNQRTTLRNIVDSTALADYDAGNTAISLISDKGLLFARSKDGVISVTLDARGNGKLFLSNYRYVSKLIAKEKWRERLWGFISGVFTGVTVTCICFYCFGII